MGRSRLPSGGLLGEGSETEPGPRPLLTALQRADTFPIGRVLQLPTARVIDQRSRSRPGCSPPVRA
jgi:hypothetical protein